MSTTEAYGGFQAMVNSQAKGQIGAAAAGLHHIHSSARSELYLGLTPEFMAVQILNPLSEARNWTGIFMDNRFATAEPQQELPDYSL